MSTGVPDLERAVVQARASHGNVDAQCPRLPLLARPELAMRGLGVGPTQARVAGDELAVQAGAEREPQERQREGVGDDPWVAERRAQLREDSPAMVALP